MSNDIEPRSPSLDWDDIPREIQRVIVGFCDVATVLRLSETSERSYCTWIQDEETWETLCQAYFLSPEAQAYFSSALHGIYGPHKVLELCPSASCWRTKFYLLYSIKNNWDIRNALWSQTPEEVLKSLKLVERSLVFMKHDSGFMSVILQTVKERMRKRGREDSFELYCALFQSALLLNAATGAEKVFSERPSACKSPGTLFIPFFWRVLRENQSFCSVEAVTALMLGTIPFVLNLFIIFIQYLWSSDDTVTFLTPYLFALLSGATLWTGDLLPFNKLIIAVVVAASAFLADKKLLVLSPCLIAVWAIRHHLMSSLATFDGSVMHFLYAVILIFVLYLQSALLWFVWMSGMQQLVESFLRRIMGVSVLRNFVFRSMFCLLLIVRLNYTWALRLGYYTHQRANSDGNAADWSPFRIFIGLTTICACLYLLTILPITA